MILVLVLGLSGSLWAGTSGTLTGVVTDGDGKPVLAATVLLVGTRLGAYTDAEGRFTILNVPAGTYSVKVSRLGFNSVTTEEVQLSADRQTTLDVGLGGTTLKTEEVVVIAERPPVDLKLTSSQATLTTKEIEELPVQSLDDVVNLQSGVVDGHFRGGRSGEVQYQVDGVSVNNAFNNASSVQIDRSLLQEVQVISGTFDAEYGQAMSGVVNAVLKQGTEDFELNGEALVGGWLFPGKEDVRLTDDTFRPTAIQNFQISMSGPVPIGRTTFLASARRNVFDDYVYGERRFVPTDRADLEAGTYTPSGNGEKVPLGYAREWSGLVKLTNTSLDNAKINYQALVNHGDSRRTDFAWRLNPDGLSTQESFSISHGFDWSQTLGASTFLDLSVRQNYFKYEDFAYADTSDTRYDAAGQPISDRNYENGAVVQGVQLGRFRQETNAYLLKASVVSRLNPEHQMKTGIEASLPEVSFGAPGYLTYSSVGGVERLVRHGNEPPDFPGIATYYPVAAAAYLQDQMELPDLIVRAGLRFNYFDARSTIPSDLSNPANAIAGAPESHPQDTTAKMSVSPRLGVAYPIEDSAAIHFAYGHFSQFPAIGTMFTNSDYDVLANLQAGTDNFGVMGNPDVKPEQTIQYEIGYKQVLTPDLGFDLTLFYKDIRDLLGVEFIETYTGARYPRLTNIDFGNVYGLTLAVDHRQFGPISLGLDYTWQRALGNSSDPNETATRAAAGEDPRPRLVPFNWDQRHTLNVTASLAKPDNYSVSTVVKVSSGQPYTPVLEAGFGQGLNTNSGRKPSGFLVDLRAAKNVGPAGRFNLFLRVFNVFDTRFFNGFVFDSTGSPDYSRFTEADRVTLENPTRFYQPRRIEIGLQFGLGGT
jgi:outer membrane receptor protein involved in Fe transport